MSSDNNVANSLKRIAGINPNKIAIFAPVKKRVGRRYKYKYCTYKELDNDSNILAKGLRLQGINRGSIIVLMVSPSISFFTLVFAIFKIGAVPVLIDPGMGLKNLKQCIKGTVPDVFIGSLKAHLARLTFGWNRGLFKQKIIVGKKYVFCGKSLKSIKIEGDKLKTAFSFPDLSPADMAAIIFTSGSTGPPKGVIFTHENFSALVDILKDTYNLRKDEIDLCTFPLFGLIAPALEMTSVIPVMNFTRPSKVNAEHIFNIVKQFGVTNLFGSPALIKRITTYGLKNKIVLNSLRRVISAGAPMSLNTLQNFCKLLKNKTQLFTPYGATEALPVTSIGSQEILNETVNAYQTGKGICIGRPLYKTELSIIKISDDPIDYWSSALLVKAGEIGEITVAGPQVTKQYLTGKNANHLHKIINPETGEVHHRMGDLGYYDNKGRIWFMGRKSHRIITAIETLYTIPIESVFNYHPAVYRTALVGVYVKNKKIPVLIVELEEFLNRNQKQKLRIELLELALSNRLTNMIKTILFYKHFPVDIRHNAKINREKLAKWAIKKIN